MKILLDHMPLVRVMAMGMARRPADIDDLVQESCLWAMLRSEKAKAEAEKNHVLFLRTCVRLAYRSIYKTYRKHHEDAYEHVPLHEALDVEEPSPPPVMEELDFSILSRREKHVVDLWIEGGSLTGIGEALNLSHQRVSQIFHRAVEKLRRDLRLRSWTD